MQQFFLFPQILRKMKAFIVKCYDRNAQGTDAMTIK